MKKVLITGSNGQLGYELQRSVLSGYECIAADRQALDISDTDAVMNFVAEHQPDVIINSAAYTAVDKAEEETELAIAINTGGAANLAKAAKANECKLVQISTDFVFDGKACSPYPVDAKTNPDGYYGKTKRDGDNKVLDILGDDALIIRTSWLYSAHGNNFVKTMLKFMAEREELEIIADQIGTPTWANSLANAVWQSIELNTTGIHHWSDAGVASWYDFAYAIMEEGVAIGLLDKPIRINAITTADYPTAASRPCYSVMDKTTTWKALQMQSEHWRVSLRKMLLELKENNQKMRRLLVTGGAGFIGANFVYYWMRQHPEDHVVVLDALTYAGNEASLDDLKDKPNFKFVAGSIADQTLVESLLVDEKLDTIVNFAAESHVDRSISGPDVFLETNVIGTHNILKAARKVWIENEATANPDHRFHHVSTDEVYGELDDDSPGFTEEHVYAPNSPYSASKASSDHIVRAYHHTFGLNVSTTNCSNNYGPYQYPEKLIPLFLTNILRNKALPVYGTGKNVRDWLFADDHAQGIDLILASDKVGEVYNIGGNNEWNNMDIIQLLCESMDKRFAENQELSKQYPEAAPAQGKKSADLITFVEDRAGHDWRYAIDASRFKRELGYDPVETFETGIQKTIDWYLDNEDWWRPLLVK